MAWRHGRKQIEAIWQSDNLAKRVKTVHLTLFTMGEIFIIFSLFSDICYFLQIYEK